MLTFPSFFLCVLLFLVCYPVGHCANGAIAVLVFPVGICGYYILCTPKSSGDIFQYSFKVFPPFFLNKTLFKAIIFEWREYGRSHYYRLIKLEKKGNYQIQLIIKCEKIQAQSG
jgi:hypothetical protein